MSTDTPVRSVLPPAPRASKAAYLEARTDPRDAAVVIDRVEMALKLAITDESRLVAITTLVREYRQRQQARVGE